MEEHASWLEGLEEDGAVRRAWYREFLEVIQESWMGEDGIVILAEGRLPSFVDKVAQELRPRCEEGGAVLIGPGSFLAQLARLPPRESREWVDRDLQLKALRLVRELCEAL